MKIVTAIITALTLAPIIAHAQENAAQDTQLSVTTSLGYESKYVSLGTQYAEAIYEPTLDLGYGDYYFSLWMGIPAENAERYETEADLSAGWSHALTGPFSIDLGVTRYAYNRIADNFLSRNDSLEFYVGLSADLPLSPAFYAFRDIDFNGNTFEFSLSHNFPLGKSFDIALAGALGYITNDEIDYVYYSACADLEYSMESTVTFFAGARAGGSDMDRIFGDGYAPTVRRNAVWWALGARMDF